MSSCRRLKLIGVAGLIAVLLSSLTMGAFAEDSETGDPGDPVVQYDAVYMPVDRIESFGLNVLTWCPPEGC